MNRRDVIKILGLAPTLPMVKAVERLSVESGDAIVLKFEGFLSCDAAERLQKTFSAALAGQFPKVPIIILDQGMDIQVLKKNA